MAIEEVGFQFDRASLENTIKATEKLNTAFEVTETTSIQSAKSASGAWQSVSSSFAKAAEQSVGYADRMTSSIDRIIRSSERIAGTAVFYVAATKAAAIHAQVTDSVVNSYRALRIALSPTPLTVFTVAAGVAAEATIKMVLANERLINQQALLAARSGRDFGDVRTLSIAGKIGGGQDLLGLGKAPEQLTGLAGQLKSLIDPVDRAQFAVKEFGDNAEKALGLLDDRMVTNISRAKELSQAIDGPTRTSLAQLASDLHRPTEELKKFGDEIRYLSEKARTGILITIGATTGTLRNIGGNIATARENEVQALREGAYPGLKFGGKGIDIDAELANAMATQSGRIGVPLPASAASTYTDLKRAQTIAVGRDNSLEGLRDRLSGANARLGTLTESFQLNAGDPARQSLLVPSLISANRESIQLAARVAALEKVVKPDSFRVGMASFRYGGFAAMGLEVLPEIAKLGTLTVKDQDITTANEKAADLASGRAFGEGLIGRGKQDAATQKSILDIDLESQRDTLNRRAQQSTRLAELGGLDGMDAIRKGYEVRIDLAHQLSNIQAERIAKEVDASAAAVMTARARKDLERDISIAQQEAALKIAELQHHQSESIKGPASNLFNTLFTNPRGFGSQLGSTLRGAVLKPVTDGLGEMTARALSPMIFGADGASGIAGAMHGLFGGRSSVLGTRTNPMAVEVVGGLGWGGSGTSMAGLLTSHGVSMPGGSTNPLAKMLGVSPSYIGDDTQGIGANSASQHLRFRMGSQDFAYGDGGGSELSRLPSGLINRTGEEIGGVPTLGSGGYTAGSGTRGVSGGSTNSVTGLAKLLGIGSKNGGTGLSDLKASWGETWGDLKDTFGIGTGKPGINGGVGVDSTTFSDVATSPGAAAVYMAAGVPLTMAGLTGQRRGTAGGILESTGGGALLGAGIGTMIMPGLGTAIGAGVGALAGFGASLGEKLAGVESPRNEAKRLVKQQYGVSINNNMADQIVAIANSSYAQHVSIAVRSPEVRKMMGLYAAGTNQSMPQSASMPHGASLIESGGRLQQQSVYQYGNPYLYSSSLPVYGGGGGGSLPSPGGNGGPTYVSLNFDGKNAGDAMTGQFVTPTFVQSQTNAAWNSSSGRVESAMMMSEPGTIIS